MTFDELEALLQQQRTAAVTTYRRDGRPQMSLVLVGSFEGGLAFTTQGSSAKATNLQRDPRCAMLVARPNWRGYAVLDGDAELWSPDNTDAERLRLEMRALYRVIAGRDHPDWPDYDRAMVEQRRFIIILRPGRLYGTGASS